MFCKHCGATLPDGVKFCPSCVKPTPNTNNNIPKPVGGTGTGGSIGTGMSGFGSSHGSGSSYTDGMNPYPGQSMKVKKTSEIRKSKMVCAPLPRYTSGRESE